MIELDPCFLESKYLFPEADEMMGRLLEVNKANTFVQDFYPSLVTNMAGQNKKPIGIKFALQLATNSFGTVNEFQPNLMLSLEMIKSDILEALIDDKDFLEKLLEYLDTI